MDKYILSELKTRLWVLSWAVEAISKEADNGSELIDFIQNDIIALVDKLEVGK
jgi:hypothetical protein